MVNLGFKEIITLNTNNYWSWWSSYLFKLPKN